MAVPYSHAEFADLLVKHVMAPLGPNKNSLLLLKPGGTLSGTLFWLRGLIPDESFDACRLLFEKIHLCVAPDGQNRVEMGGIPTVDVYKAALEGVLANLDSAVEAAGGSAE